MVLPKGVAIHDRSAKARNGSCGFDDAAVDAAQAIGEGQGLFTTLQAGWQRIQQPLAGLIEGETLAAIGLSGSRHRCALLLCGPIESR